MRRGKKRVGEGAGKVLSFELASCRWKKKKGERVSGGGGTRS